MAVEGAACGAGLRVVLEGAVSCSGGCIWALDPHPNRQVAVTSIDDFIRGRKMRVPAVIKIDAEGLGRVGVAHRARTSCTVHIGVAHRGLWLGSARYMSYVWCSL